MTRTFGTRTFAPLSRRTLLKSASGFAVGLPLLEAMLDGRPARAQSNRPKRYVVMTSGQSTGQDGESADVYVPAAAGAITTQMLRPALTGLADIVGDFNIISGLGIPSQGLDGYGSIPTAGKASATHDQTLSPLLSGTANTNDSYGAHGATSDYLVAEAFGDVTPFPQLVYRVQLEELNGHYAEISYRSNGNPVNNSVADPAVAWDSIFRDFVPSSDGSAPSPEAVAAARRARRRTLVLDAILGSANSLSQRLGMADRQRLSDHLDQLRDLETRLTAAPPTTSTAQCVVPNEPGGFNRSGSYNDEIPRGELLVDLITMAFACDRSRVASLLISFSMPMFSLPGHEMDVHEESHSGSASDFLASHRWHVSLFGRLVRNLKALPEGDGTLLDNTAIAFCLEAGHGRDAAAGDGDYRNAHSTENMVMLTAGGAGGALVQGQHIVPAPQGAHPNGAAKARHPAAALVSLMNAVDVPVSGLGDVDGRIDELLVG